MRYTRLPRIPLRPRLALTPTRDVGCRQATLTPPRHVSTLSAQQRHERTLPVSVGVVCIIGAFGISLFAWKRMGAHPVLMDSATSAGPTLAQRDEETRKSTAIDQTSPMRLRMEQFVKEQQAVIVSELEKVDGGGLFRKDEWHRPEGGGGVTCVLQDGNVFEKAGVGVSVVYGTLPKAAIQRMRVNHKALDPNVQSLEFFAAGISLVLHPKNPMAPTVHLNYRYFETSDGSSWSNGIPTTDGNDVRDATAAAPATRHGENGGTWWFGGGSDLTPSYLFEEDAVHFHRTLKAACDKHDATYYPRFKRWCDQYFYNKHRTESRGIGGIFFDDLDEAEGDREQTFAFIQSCLRSFLPTYLPILARRRDMPFSPAEKEWQQLRRGRYVEFNLVHDRGTSFGLNTPGARVESILMSLPLTATWKYMDEPEPDSREQRLVDALRTPRDWV